MPHLGRGPARGNSSRRRRLEDAAPTTGSRARQGLHWRVPLEALARAASAFGEDRGTQMAASISFYAFFSLFPLTLLAVSLFGIVLRDEGLQIRVLDAIVDFLPLENETVENSIRNVADLGPTLTIFSFLGTAWAAAALSASVRSALNVVFGSGRRRPFLRAKLVDFTLLPIIGLPLLGGLVISTMIQFARDEMREWLPAFEGLFAFAWGIVAILVPLILTFVAFLLLYWLLPNRSLRFRYLWPGALFAAIAFEALKLGFTYYLATFGTFDVVYGSLAAVAVLLFWVFLSANILILGAELAAEIPGVLHPGPGRDVSVVHDARWRRSRWRVLLGLVMVVDEEGAAAAPAGRRRPRDEARMAVEDPAAANPPGAEWDG